MSELSIVWKKTAKAYWHRINRRILEDEGQENIRLRQEIADTNLQYYRLKGAHLAYYNSVQAIYDQKDKELDNLRATVERQRAEISHKDFLIGECTLKIAEYERKPAEEVQVWVDGLKQAVETELAALRAAKEQAEAEVERLTSAIRRADCDDSTLPDPMLKWIDKTFPNRREKDIYELIGRLGYRSDQYWSIVAILANYEEFQRSPEVDVSSGLKRFIDGREENTKALKAKVEELERENEELRHGKWLMRDFDDHVKAMAFAGRRVEHLQQRVEAAETERDALRARVAELVGTLVRVKRYLSIPRGLKRSRREEGTYRMIEKVLSKQAAPKAVPK